MNISIIGAGFGGLATAALLSEKGHNVTVYEKNEQYGGRARIHKDKGFQFDMGPSWYLMPNVFEEFYKNLNSKPEDYFELQRLDPSYRIFFGKDNIVDIYANMEKNLDVFDRLEENGGAKLKNYLKGAEEKYKTAMDGLIYQDYGSIFDFFNLNLLKQGAKLDIFRNLDDLVNKHFDSDEARKILEYSIGFLGGSPKITPAIYQLMSYVDFIEGVWFPKGGIHKVAESIYKIAKENGTKFKFNTEITEIEVKDGRAKYLKIDGNKFPTDLVIVN